MEKLGPNFKDNLDEKFQKTIFTEFFTTISQSFPQEGSLLLRSRRAFSFYINSLEQMILLEETRVQKNERIILHLI
jgi:hypothetical protein